MLDFPIDGYVYRTIPLYRKVSGSNAHPHSIVWEKVGEAMVDGCYFTELNQHKWGMKWGYNSYYAQRAERVNGEIVTIRMSREVLGLPRVAGKGGLEAHHVNHATLDNRRFNLMEATRSQNSSHRTHLRVITRFKGVSYNPIGTGVRARVVCHGKIVQFPTVYSEVEAALMYFYAAKFLNGDFCVPHEIPDDELPTEERQEELWQVVCEHLIKAGLMLPRPEH